MWEVVQELISGSVCSETVAHRSLAVFFGW